MEPMKLVILFLFLILNSLSSLGKKVEWQSCGISAHFVVKDVSIYISPPQNGIEMFQVTVAGLLGNICKLVLKNKTKQNKYMLIYFGYLILKRILSPITSSLQQQ